MTACGEISGEEFAALIPYTASISCAHNTAHLW